MRKVFVLLLASLCVMLTMSLVFTNVASAQPACVVCYSSKEEAQQHVEDYVTPRDCFVWYDPINCPEENRHWRALSDCWWGCAHWVAHQLNLKCGVGCDKGYCIRISQITSGRTEITDLRCCKVGDIWTTDDKGHSGIVRQVDLENKKVEVESCSSKYGGVGKEWRSSGICWRDGSCDGTACGDNAHCSADCKCKCDDGYKDCDEDWSNGCEVNLKTDPNNCGKCGRKCPPENPICEEGECVPEASTLVLFATGLLSLAGYVGLKRRKTK